MNIDKKLLEKIEIVILLVATTKVFYVAPLPEVFLHSASNVLFGVVVTVIILLITFFRNKKVVFGKFGVDIVILYIILIINIIYMKFNYNYPIHTIVMAVMPFGLLLGYYCLTTFIETKRDFNDLLNIVEILAMILAIVLLIQELIFSLKGIFFLNVDMTSSFSMYGRLYDVSEGIIRVSCIISAYKLIRHKFSLVSLLSLLCCGAAVVLVDKSRIYILSIVLSIFGMIIFHSLNKSNVNYLKSFFYLILIGIGIVGIANVYYSIMNTLNNANDGSNYARTYAINYYFSLFKGVPRYIFTGLGVVVPSSDSWYYTLIKGPFGIYNYTDIGIFGIFASLGIFAVIWYIYIIIKSIYLSKRTPYKLLCWGLLIEMIVSIFTLTYFDASRLSSLMLLLVIVNSNYYISMRKKD